MSAEGTTRTLKVEGMHCSSCVAAVERALRSVEGVSAAHVDLHAGSARVQLTGDTSAERLVEAARSAGFPARVLAEGEETAASDDEQLVRIWRTRTICALAGLAALVLLRGAPDHALVEWSQFLIAAGLQVGVGAGFYRGAWRAWRRRTADMDTLVAFGTTAAFLGGVVDALRGGAAMTFLDAAMILTFLSAGRWLEARAKGRAVRSLHALLELAPETALVVVEGETREVPVAALVAGETVLVRPGDRIAVDALVVTGEGEVDESWLTGEPLPAKKGAGDRVYAGTLNGPAPLRVQVEHAGRSTALARVADRVRQAQASKADVQRLADRLAAHWVPVVVVIALLSGAVWWIAADSASALRTTVAVAIVACPCALGLATPTAIVVAVASAARKGVLVRNAQALELAGDVRTLVLDKTGTLTSGQPRITRLESVGTLESEVWLALAASAESTSSHPLAEAICREARRRGLDVTLPDEAETALGAGVAARIGGHSVRVGSRPWLEREGVADAERWPPAQDAAATPLGVAVDSSLTGVLWARDEVPAQSERAVSSLRAAGYRLVVLSGDTEAAVQHVARRLEIETALSRQTPLQKYQWLSERAGKGEGIAMVGDGINDAAALAAADLGIAMGRGADVALESADVVLVGDDLEALPRALALARATRRVIRQNLTFALLYNVFLIPFAAGAFVPWLGHSLPPTAAAAAMALSSVSVLTNSLRLAKR